MMVIETWCAVIVDSAANSFRNRWRDQELQHPTIQELSKVKPRGASGSNGKPPSVALTYYFHTHSKNDLKYLRRAAS